MDHEKDLFKSISFGKSKVDKINEFLQDKLKRTREKSQLLKLQNGWIGPGC